MHSSQSGALLFQHPGLATLFCGWVQEACFKVDFYKARKCAIEEMYFEPLCYLNRGNTVKVSKMRVRNLILAALIGSFSGALCSFLMFRVHWGAADFGWALHAARDLLNGLDPYRHPIVPDYAPYPLPAALVALPFSFLPDEIAAGLFFGLSSALLAWCLLAHGQNWPLLPFLSWPFMYALICVQWVPLVICLWFLPPLLLMALIKPQIALPLALTRGLSRSGVISTISLLAISLLIYPSWPWNWLRQIQGYQGILPPLLTLPLGPLLLLVLIRWRERRSWLLILMAVMPQRVLYDQFALLLVANSRKEKIALVLISWTTLPVLLHYKGWARMPGGWHFWIIVTLYLPALAIILRTEIASIVKFAITETFNRLAVSNKN